MKKIENIIDKFNKVHGDKYDYSKVEYINTRTKVLIGCPYHGFFEQTPKRHLKGQGCPICGQEKAKLRDNINQVNHRKTTEEFKNEIYDLYGDKYEILGEYINNKTPIEIYCHCLDVNGQPHGTFKTKPNDILNGHECRLCGNNKIKKAQEKKRIEKKIVFKEKKISKRIVPFDLFKKRLIEKVGNAFEVNDDDFQNMSKNISIKCKECNSTFYRKPTVLLNTNSHCPICSKKKFIDKRFKTLEQYIEDANKVHNNFYSYEHAQYNGSSNYITVTCPEHGDFSIEANSHLMGHGCPLHYCNKSKQEVELQNFIKELVGNDSCVFNSKSILNSNKELDIFIPDKRFAIEYNGLYWHNEINKPNDYHLNKLQECQNQNIDLFHIFEDEWINKREIIKSMIRYKLGLIEEKIYARKCIVREVSNMDTTRFLEDNHLQGKCGGNYKIGLYYNNELVSLMVFGESRHFIGNNKKKWELIRFVNKINTSVIGGASKLLHFFIKSKNPNSIISYADKRWSKGKIYEELGFIKYNESKPNYYYVINNKRVYRFNMRKSILIDKFNCKPNQTEREFCFSKKWYRIYDCGCLCYEWKKE